MFLRDDPWFIFYCPGLGEDTWICNIIHFSIRSILAKNGPSTPTESASLFSNNEIHGQIAVSSV